MHQSTQQPERRQFRRVMIVDSHIEHARTLAMLLKCMGHSTEYAINGYAALRLLERFGPELVFLEMVLPDCEGPILSHLLHAKRQPLRVLAMSLHADAELRRRASLAGCERFLVKPLDLEQVERLLG